MADERLNKGVTISESAKPEFSVTVNDLRELMEMRGHEACECIRLKYSGLDNLCEELHVSPIQGNLFYYFVLTPDEACYESKDGVTGI